MQTDLVTRAKSILLQPVPTWQVIAAEPDTPAGLYQRYLMILAAIPAVCGFIGMSLIGFGAFGVSVRVPLLAGLANMVVTYVLSLVGVYVIALLIEALAPTFGGQKDRMAALKVSVYASTAALLGGVFSLLPMLSILGVVAALYSIYLVYTGLPVLMRNAPEKSAAYTVVVVVAAIVIGIVVGALSSLFMPRAFPGSAGLGSPGVVTLQTPGGEVKVDTAAIEAASKKMEAAARQIEQSAKDPANAANAANAGQQAAAAMAALTGGGQGSLPAEALKAALPQQLGGLERKSFQVQDGRAAGLPGTIARAAYGSGAKSLELQIADLGGLGALMGAAAAMAQGESDDGRVLEKSWQQSGRTLRQKVHKDGSRAELNTTLKNGLMIEVTGNGMGLAEVQGAMAQLNLDALEAMARPGKS